uniref:H+-transporting two-sector ATPase 58K chain (Fragments) n=1 Tax=Bos taurus TaxID=9913 RepID=Q7M3J5_BOVIN
LTYKYAEIVHLTLPDGTKTPVSEDMLGRNSVALGQNIPIFSAAGLKAVVGEEALTSDDLLYLEFLQKFER